MIPWSMYVRTPKFTLSIMSLDNPDNRGCTVLQICTKTCTYIQHQPDTDVVLDE